MLSKLLRIQQEQHVVFIQARCLKLIDLQLLKLCYIYIYIYGVFFFTKTECEMFGWAQEIKESQSGWVQEENVQYAY